MALDLNSILEFAVRKGISDVHLKESRPPAYRVNSDLATQRGAMPLSKSDMTAFLDKVLVEDAQRRILAEEGNVDAAYELPGLARFRVNVFRQYTGLSMAIRVIPLVTKGVKELGLPPILEEIAKEHRGLVLVTGTTGSGKSTTLAAIMELINQTRAGHLLTIEDPVEFVLQEKKCTINQREVGANTCSFASALRAALRQDPDVILIGELRDKETIDIALQAAETGHLVLSTMHTIDAAETINRAVSVFPPHDQKQIRDLFASVLRWVVSQRLLDRRDGKGRIPAVEIFRQTPRLLELVQANAGQREIAEQLDKGHKVYGTQTFDLCLMELYRRKLITQENALQHCSNPSDFKLRVSGID